MCIIALCLFTGCSKPKEQASAKEESRALVTRFFSEVWNSPYRLETIDELVDENFIITSAGKDIKGRDDFKKWVQGLGSQFNDLKVDILEMMVTDDGQRVITRMLVTGGNNGVFGTEADNEPISMTVISIIAVKDGKIVHNWVERSAFELHQKLIAESSARAEQGDIEQPPSSLEFK